MADGTTFRAYRQKMTHIVNDSTNKSAQAIIAWVITILTFGYMLPWAIAATRGKSNAGAVGWINLLLGWTIIGWIIALVMACGAHQAIAVAPPAAGLAPPPPPPAKSDPVTGAPLPPQPVLAVDPATGAPVIDPVTGLQMVIDPVSGQPVPQLAEPTPPSAPLAY